MNEIKNKIDTLESIRHCAWKLEDTLLEISETILMLNEKIETLEEEDKDTNFYKEKVELLKSTQNALYKQFTNIRKEYE